MQVPNWNDLDQLVDQVQDHEVRLALRMMLHCGLRASEVLELRWSDIGDDYMLVRGKGGKQRMLPVSEAIRTDIESIKRKHCLYTTIVSIILKHVHAICQCSPTLQSSVVLQFLLFIPNTQHYFMKNIRQRHLNVGKPCLINYFWHTIYNACFLCLNNYFPVIFFHRFTPNKSVISHPRKNNRQQPFSIDRRCRIKGYVNRWFIKRFNGRTVFYSQSYYTVRLFIKERLVTCRSYINITCLNNVSVFRFFNP